MPADNDLRRGFTVFIRQLTNNFLIEYPFAALRKRAPGLGLDLMRRIPGVKLALLYELLDKEQLADAAVLATAIKQLPVTVPAPSPVAQAISTAGGVVPEALDGQLMLHQRPGVFCCGEMLDWEAPTGGYLLTACLASGRVAGQGAAA